MTLCKLDRVKTINVGRFIYTPFQSFQWQKINVFLKPPSGHMFDTPVLKNNIKHFCSSVLLLAYMKGNANLCRAIVRSGARMGLNNNQGINIFNYQVATKQLLFRLLGETLGPGVLLNRYAIHCNWFVVQ